MHCRFSGNLRSSEEGADTIIWLALQPKEKLVSGGFYFDRAEAPKHLKLAGTRQSHAIIDSIVDTLRSMLASHDHGFSSSSQSKASSGSVNP